MICEIVEYFLVSRDDESQSARTDDANKSNRSGILCFLLLVKNFRTTIRFYFSNDRVLKNQTITPYLCYFLEIKHKHVNS